MTLDNSSVSCYSVNTSKRRSAAYDLPPLGGSIHSVSQYSRLMPDTLQMLKLLYDRNNQKTISHALFACNSRLIHFLRRSRNERNKTQGLFPDVKNSGRTDGNHHQKRSAYPNLQFMERRAPGGIPGFLQRSERRKNALRCFRKGIIKPYPVSRTP